MQHHFSLAASSIPAGPGWLGAGDCAWPCALLAKAASHLCAYRKLPPTPVPLRTISRIVSFVGPAVQQSRGNRLSSLILAACACLRARRVFHSLHAQLEDCSFRLIRDSIDCGGQSPSEIEPKTADSAPGPGNCATSTTGRSCRYRRIRPGRRSALRLPTQSWPDRDGVP